MDVNMATMSPVLLVPNLAQHAWTGRRVQHAQTGLTSMKQPLPVSLAIKVVPLAPAAQCALSVKKVSLTLLPDRPLYATPVVVKTENTHPPIVVLKFEYLADSIASLAQTTVPAVCPLPVARNAWYPINSWRVNV